METCLSESVLLAVVVVLFLFSDKSLFLLLTLQNDFLIGKIYKLCSCYAFLLLR